MDPLKHWYPVALGRAVGTQPVGVRIWDQEIVLFRNAGGKVGALVDRCVHRGMRLSKGAVEGDCLVCPYHGWSYDVAGEGRSPGNDGLKVMAPGFDVIERHGVVWVKSETATDTVPAFEYPGYHLAYVLHRIVKVPLELLVDNFIEIEHTCTGHWLLGFDTADMPVVQLTSERQGNGLHIVCQGPQKKIPSAIALAVGIRSGDHFVADWTMECAPLRATYTFTYQDTAGQFRSTRAREVAYFARVSAEESMLVAFYFTNKAPTALNKAFLYPMFRRWVDYEYERDRQLLENIADRRTDLKGFRLGRFDKPLVEFRRAMQSAMSDHAPAPAPAREAVTMGGGQAAQV